MTTILYILFSIHSKSIPAHPLSVLVPLQPNMPLERRQPCGNTLASDETAPIKRGATDRSSGDQVLMRRIDNWHRNAYVFSELPNVPKQLKKFSVRYLKERGRHIRSILDPASEGETFVGLEVVVYNLCNHVSMSRRCVGSVGSVGCVGGPGGSRGSVPFCRSRSSTAQGRSPG